MLVGVEHAIACCGDPDMHAVVLRIGSDDGLWANDQIMNLIFGGGLTNAECLDRHGTNDSSARKGLKGRQRLFSPHSIHFTWYARHGDDGALRDVDEPTWRRANRVWQRA